MPILEFVLNNKDYLEDLITITMSKIYLLKLPNIILSLKKYILSKMAMAEQVDYFNCSKSIYLF